LIHHRYEHEQDASRSTSPILTVFSFFFVCFLFPAATDHTFQPHKRTITKHRNQPPTQQSGQISNTSKKTVAPPKSPEESLTERWLNPTVHSRHRRNVSTDGITMDLDAQWSDGGDDDDVGEVDKLTDINEHHFEGEGDISSRSVASDRAIESASMENPVLSMISALTTEANGNQKTGTWRLSTQTRPTILPTPGLKLPMKQLQLPCTRKDSRRRWCLSTNIPSTELSPRSSSSWLLSSDQ
jgi:hypothetical protein